jgi:hypothetical protein
MMHKVHPESKESSKVQKNAICNIRRHNLLKRKSTTESEGPDYSIRDTEECLYAQNIDASISDRELSKLLECLDFEQTKDQGLKIPMEPRSVFYISVGSSKLKKIKSVHGDTQITEIKDRLKAGVNIPDFIAKIAEKTFADNQQAKEFAGKYINDFDIEHDKDFHLVDLENAKVMSCVSDALVSTLQLAMRHSAALVIPDYNSGSEGSLHIEAAILHADFRGPVINVGNDDWTAVEPHQARETFVFRSQAKPKPFLLRRATHSFQLRGKHGADHSRFAARLARAIAGRPPIAAGRAAAAAEPPRAAPPVVCVAACGGRSVAEHVAALARHRLPIVVLEGSGRLCDFLPGVYAR